MPPKRPSQQELDLSGFKNDHSPAIPNANSAINSPPLPTNTEALPSSLHHTRHGLQNIRNGYCADEIRQTETESLQECWAEEYGVTRTELNKQKMKLQTIASTSKRTTCAYGKCDGPRCDHSDIEGEKRQRKSKCKDPQSEDHPGIVTNLKSSEEPEHDEDSGGVQLGARNDFTIFSRREKFESIKTWAATVEPYKCYGDQIFPFGTRQQRQENLLDSLPTTQEQRDWPRPRHTYRPNSHNLQFRNQQQEQQQQQSHLQNHARVTHTTGSIPRDMVNTWAAVMRGLDARGTHASAVKQPVSLFPRYQNRVTVSSSDAEFRLTKKERKRMDAWSFERGMQGSMSSGGYRDRSVSPRETLEGLTGFQRLGFCHCARCSVS